MPLPDLTMAHSPETLFTEICTYIAQAEATVDDRGPISLTGLDKAVETLCSSILQLEGDEAKRYTAKLAEMMDAIEQLQTKMMKLQGEIATTMKSLSTQQKAARAYINTPKAED